MGEIPPPLREGKGWRPLGRAETSQPTRAGFYPLYWFQPRYIGRIWADIFCGGFLKYTFISCLCRRRLGDCLFSELIMPVYLTVRRTPPLPELLSLSVMSHLLLEPSRTSAGGKTCKTELTRSVYRGKTCLSTVKSGQTST